MTVDLDLSFPANYTVKLLDELPGRGDSNALCFPGNLRAGADGLLVRVSPTRNDPWTGVFAFGGIRQATFSRVLAMPDPDSICIVSRGAGYVVDASRPQTWETVPSVPVTDARAAPGAGIVVFANYTELVAYSARGLAWRTKRLAWDRFSIASVSSLSLVGEYEDIGTGETRRFEVDLTSGASRGGVEH